MEEEFPKEPEIIDLQTLTTFIHQVSVPLLGLDLDQFWNLITSPGPQHVLTQFAGDQQVPALIIIKGEEDVVVTIEMDFRGANAACLAFLKRDGVGALENLHPSSQLQTVSLGFLGPDSSPF